MKPLLILLLGCLPLAILTAFSFLELRSIEDAPGPRLAALGSPPNAAPDEKTEKQTKAEKPVVEGLGEVDLLSGDTLSGLDALPVESSLRPLQDAWPQWTKARQLVQRSLKIERGAQAAGVEQLQDACKRLEEIKGEYERAKPPGSDNMLSLLDRRIAALNRQITRATQKGEADALQAQAQAEFEPKRYGQCVSLCGQWLAKYSQVDAAQAATVKTLRDRAQFWDDVEQMSVQWQAADSPSRRKVLMDGFLGKHAGRNSPTLTQQENQKILQCQGEQANLDARLQAEEMGRNAAEEIRRLRESPPSRFGDRLQAAVEIRRKYATEDVAVAIRKLVGDWLTTALPEKQLQEPAEIQEAETRQGEILRGFFRKVDKPDGSLVGYQRYPSYEEFLHPVAQVGTYAKDDLLGPPGESLPRQSMTRYTTSRSRLLAQLGSKAAWAELLALCDEFEAKLPAYQKKPGSSSETLSFQPAARVARYVLADPVWSSMEKVFGP